MGRARRAQPRSQPRGRAPRPALRARPVVAAGVHDRRQRRDQRRRPALPGLGRHVGARARGRRRARRRAVTMLGGLEPDQPGYDLRGCFVGSEGTMGIATRIAVRLTPDPPAVATMLRDFDSIDAAAATVSGIIAGGDPARRARDDGRPHHARGRGLRRRGLPARRASGAARRGRRARRRGRRAGRRGPRDRDRATAPRSVRVAADDAERALLWKGRKSAFGAIARIAPDYYLHDAVVPRTRLVEVLRQRVRDRRRARPHHDERVPRRRRQPASADRVRPPRAGRLGARARRRQRDPRDVHRRRRRAHGRARRRHREARLDAAGVHAPTTSTRRRGCATRSIPTGRANPQKVLPRGSRCGELQRVPEGAWM